MIEHFYESIEATYTKRINDSKINKKGYKKVTKNIRKNEEELEQLKTHLESSHWHYLHSTIKKVLQMNLMKTIRHSSAEVNNLLKNW